MNNIEYLIGYNDEDHGNFCCSHETDDLNKAIEQYKDLEATQPAKSWRFIKKATVFVEMAVTEEGTAEELRVL